MHVNQVPVGCDAQRECSGFQQEPVVKLRTSTLSMEALSHLTLKSSMISFLSAIHSLYNHVQHRFLLAL